MSETDNRQVGDVVGIFDDDHVFSEKEREIFQIVKVVPTTGTLKLLYPKIHTLARSTSTDWVLGEAVEYKEAWKDADGNWCEIIEKPRFPIRYEDGTLKENYSRIPENTATTLITKEVSAEK
jgi:hypothetical protein